MRSSGSGRTDVWTRALVVAASAALVPASVAGQEGSIRFPVDELERRLARDSFEIVDRRGSRAVGDRTHRVAMVFPDEVLILAKWAEAPPGGEEFNNNPRFELAAYEIQQLFLAEQELVVPPTVTRVFPLRWYRELEPDARATFRGTESVLLVLQYWLFNVTPDGFWDDDRFASDPVYARHFANFNILTYLIEHSDENTGNYLISSVPGDPRVFSVDNGVAFSSPRSDRGYRLRRIRVDRVPAVTIERLRSLTPDDLVRRLGVLAQFRIRADRTLEAMPPGPNMNPRSGIRRSGEMIQLGLTSQEIGEVWGRVTHLLREVDSGDIEVF